MTWTKSERALLVDGIASMRKRNEENESLGASGRKNTRECSGCENISSGHRFACILCSHIVCGDCSSGKCGHCRRGTRFVRLIEEDRTCARCCCTAPIKRVAFPKCGHTCCEPCAHQMSMDARDQRIDLACSFCHTEISGCWILLEEMEEKKEDKDLIGENEADAYKNSANESKESEKPEKKKWKMKRSGPTAEEWIASRIEKIRRTNSQ